MTIALFILLSSVIYTLSFHLSQSLWGGARKILLSLLLLLLLLQSSPFYEWVNWDSRRINKWFQILQTVTELIWPSPGFDLLKSVLLYVKAECKSEGKSWEKRYSLDACRNIIPVLNAAHLHEGDWVASIPEIPSLWVISPTSCCHSLSIEDCVVLNLNVCNNRDS